MRHNSTIWRRLVKNTSTESKVMFFFEKVSDRRILHDHSTISKLVSILSFSKLHSTTYTEHPWTSLIFTMSGWIGWTFSAHQNIKYSILIILIVHIILIGQWVLWGNRYSEQCKIFWRRRYLPLWDGSQVCEEGAKANVSPQDYHHLYNALSPL